MPSVISVIGKSQAGKITLIEKLVHELNLRSYRVATIRQVSGTDDIYPPDKYNLHYIQAGSVATVVSSPDKTVLIKPVVQRAAMNELVSLVGEDHDIIIAEGSLQDNSPKIQVHRKADGALTRGFKKLIAIVTDEPLETRARQFSPENIDALVDLLEKGFIQPQKNSIYLYINGTPVTLTLFPRQIITNTIIAIASCLKGISEIHTLKLFMKKG